MSILGRWSDVASVFGSDAPGETGDTAVPSGNESSSAVVTASVTDTTVNQEGSTAPPAEATVVSPRPFGDVAAVFGTDAPVNREVPVMPFPAPTPVEEAAAPLVYEVVDEVVDDVEDAPLHEEADAASVPMDEPDQVVSPVDEGLASAPAVPVPSHEGVRIRPEELEGDHLLDGVTGVQREHLAGLLSWAAWSYRAVLADLDEANARPAQSPDRFADFGEEVTRILQTAHDAAEDMTRSASAELDSRRAELDAELDRRRVELDERESAVEHHVREQEEAAVALTARARAEAESLSTSTRNAAEERLTTLLAVQESLRERLEASSNELRDHLAALANSAS